MAVVAELNSSREAEGRMQMYRLQEHYEEKLESVQVRVMGVQLGRDLFVCNLFHPMSRLAIVQKAAIQRERAHSEVLRQLEDLQAQLASVGKVAAEAAAKATEVAAASMEGRGDTAPNTATIGTTPTSQGPERKLQVTLSPSHRLRMVECEPSPIESGRRHASMSSPTPGAVGAPLATRRPPLDPASNSLEVRTRGRQGMSPAREALRRTVLKTKPAVASTAARSPPGSTSSISFQGFLDAKEGMS